MEKEIRISNNLNEIVVLASFIEELGEELSLPAETVTRVGIPQCRYQDYLERFAP